MEKEYYLLEKNDKDVVYYVLTSKCLRCYIYFKDAKITSLLSTCVRRSNYASYSDYIREVEFELLGTTKTELNKII